MFVPFNDVYTSRKSNNIYNTSRKLILWHQSSQETMKIIKHSSLILQEHFKIKQALSDFCFCVHHLDSSPFSKNLKKFISSEKPKKTDCGLGTRVYFRPFLLPENGSKTSIWNWVLTLNLVQQNVFNPNMPNNVSFYCLIKYWLCHIACISLAFWLILGMKVNGKQKWMEIYVCSTPPTPQVTSYVFAPMAH